MNTALVIVNVQKDFCPGGAVEVYEGDHIIEPINNLIHLFESHQLPIFVIRDWHTENHCSFTTNGGIWPPHCIANTPGAEFHPGIIIPEDVEVISKGEDPSVDVFSGFDETGLMERLSKMGIESVVIAGLPTDYCVKKTALDAHRMGLDVCVAIDAIRAVNARPEDGRQAIIHMQIRGVRFEDSSQLEGDFAIDLPISA